MKIFSGLFLLLFFNLVSSTAFAKWQIVVNGSNKVWKNPTYNKTYLTQSPSSFFNSANDHKKELLEIFNIYDWKVLTNQDSYILGEYIDGRGKINYFFESKTSNSIHISTQSRSINLLDVYTNFLNSRKTIDE
jgi:hypothetical protein